MCPFFERKVPFFIRALFWLCPPPPFLRGFRAPCFNVWYSDNSSLLDPDKVKSDMPLCLSRKWRLQNTMISPIRSMTGIERGRCLHKICFTGKKCTTLYYLRIGYLKKWVAHCIKNKALSLPGCPLSALPDVVGVSLFTTDFLIGCSRRAINWLFDPSSSTLRSPFSSI